MERFLHDCFHKKLGVHYGNNRITNSINHIHFSNSIIHK
jgi:hypothetical protein